MREYHKIQSIFKRDEKTHKFIFGDFSKPEFEYLYNNKWIFTEKVDGTNIRIGWNLKEVEIGGKTDNAQLHIDLIKELQRLFTFEKFNLLYPDTQMTLYGEGYGAGIQSGGKYSQEKKFVLFDIKIGDFWLSRESIADIANRLGIEVVPIIGNGNLHTMINTCSEGFDSQWGGFTAEGIVARPMCELFNRKNERIIVKCKYKDFQHA